MNYQHCDNEVVVCAHNSYQIYYNIHMACAHSVWLLAAWWDIKVTYVHIYGKNNVFAAALSRWGHRGQRTIVEELKSCNWWQAHDKMFYPDFSI